jgi:hypothetical protein
MPRTLTRLDKIDNIVENAEKQGVNILKGDKLETVLSESARGNLETEGRNVTSTGLPISHVNNLEPEALVAQLNEVREAIQKINNFSQDLSADLNTIQTRQDFTKVNNWAKHATHSPQTHKKIYCASSKLHA